MSEGTKWRHHWQRRVQQWEAQAGEVGLSGIYDALHHTFRPLAPLAAQLLWVAQPTLSLFGEAESIGALADLLEHPDTPLITDDSPTPSKGGL
jgi:hypothetical protein